MNKVIIEVNGDVIQIKPMKSVKELVGILGKPPVSGRKKDFNQIREKSYSKLRKV